MDELHLKLEIDGQQEKFRPGDTISGRAQVTAAADWDPDYADVMVYWKTSGRGDEDSGVVMSESLFEEGRSNSLRMERRFSCKLPDMPWSYQGKYIKIGWYVGLFARPKRKDEFSMEHAFVLHPHPETIDPHASFEVPDKAEFSRSGRRWKIHDRRMKRKKDRNEPEVPQ